MALRYVILAHSVNGALHYDLMLEVEDSEKLRTVQLAKRLIEAGESCPARELDAHRSAYLTFEGEISGNRGSVTRVESGTYEILGASFLLSPSQGTVYRVEITKDAAKRC